jgi:hypothetical protein
MEEAMKESVLLVAPDMSCANACVEALSPSFGVEVKTSPEDAARSIAEKSPSIILCEAGLVGQVRQLLGKEGNRDVLREKWVIMAPGKVEEHLQAALANGISNIFPEAVLRDKKAGQFLLENLVDRERCFGLRRYLKPPRMLFSEEIRTKGDKREIIEKAVNYFATCGYEIHELYDARLVLEEMINNSLFHAFVNEHGEEKYHVSHFEELAPGERIEIEFGNDSESIGFAVADNGGRLDPAMVVGKLARQYYREGLYDESGRGLYLSRMFTSLLVVNIEKGKRTQMVAIFGETPQDAIKPLCVNYFE